MVLRKAADQPNQILLGIDKRQPPMGEIIMPDWEAASSPGKILAIENLCEIAARRILKDYYGLEIDANARLGASNFIDPEYANVNGGPVCFYPVLISFDDCRITQDGQVWGEAWKIASGTEASSGMQWEVFRRGVRRCEEHFSPAD